jgi:predicted nucleotidyltransferase component of viral defense system
LIQRAYITAWRAHAPWYLDAQVEQDLVLSRVLVELFSNTTIRSKLAFRGGTALNKLFLPKPERYSDDIDLVQVDAGPIDPVMTAIRHRLDAWLGKPQWKQGHGRVTFYYHFNTEFEPVTVSRLKVEVNTREHFSVLGFATHSYLMESRWFSGSAEIPSYHLDELLGTKLRALYQRKKGRDLFDLWIAGQRTRFDPRRVVDCFTRYLEHDGMSVSRAELEANLHDKLVDREFAADITPLLASDVEWDCMAAGTYVLDVLAALLPGDAWKGLGTSN